MLCYVGTLLPLHNLRKAFLWYGSYPLGAQDMLCYVGTLPAHVYTFLD